MSLGAVALGTAVYQAGQELNGRKIMKYKEPVMGFEPATCALRMRCSTTELHRLVDVFLLMLVYEYAALPLSYIGLEFSTV